MREELDKCFKNEPERTQAKKELEHFIKIWESIPVKQSPGGVIGNCWKFREKLEEKLGNWRPGIIKYNNNENWQYVDRYFWEKIGM